jgi:predicted nucleic acid-binding protein
LKEPGGDKVHELLRRAEREEVRLFMHNLNLLEVYYGLRRANGETFATVRLNQIRCLPVMFVPEIESEGFIEAGRLKSMYKFSLADAVLLAAASIRDAFVITSDHHELDGVEAAERIRFFWIR